MADRHLRYLKTAKDVSLKSREMRRQFGCVLVLKNKILAVGHNKRSHPKIPTITSQNGEVKYYALHAECNALLRCDFSVRGAVVYIHGQNVSTGNLCYSGPCELCQQILKERGIEEAVFPLKQGGYKVQKI
jgi:deoxycytidylate deaminase